MSKTIPPTCPEPPAGQSYWRGLDDLADTPEFRRWAEREFPEGASELNDPVNRRHFVKIMSASFLLAGAGLGLTGCRRPEETILPFSRLPENYVHGVAQYYATAMPTRGGAIPLVAKSNEGRPTKLEGNALHPDSNGGTDRFAQAALLNLYDPDRSMRFAQAGQTAAKDEALAQLAKISEAAAARQGAGLAFLLERSSSPSRARLIQLIKARYPQANWFLYEPVDFDVHRVAASIATGRAVTPYLRFDRAKRVLSLDCDFLGAEEENHRYIRDFAAARRVHEADKSQGEDLVNRLYAVESLLTITGANADHRLRLPASQVLPLAAALAAAIVNQGNSEFRNLVTQIPLPAGVDARWIAECAKDLMSHAGRSLVVAGYRQPAAVHLLVNAINYALGNVGQTVIYRDTPETGERSLADLAASLNAGQVDTLVIMGGNPAYNAPADLDWAKTQAKARSVIRLGYYEDETFAAAKRADDWHFPAAHFLESWGDARSSDGTLVAIQPLIAPLFDGLTELEFLARLGGVHPVQPYVIVRQTFREFAESWDYENSWGKFLHDGFYAVKAAPSPAVGLNWPALNARLRDAKTVAAPAGGQLEVIFSRDYKLDDGRFNNNGWLQELPDPITKITWDNVLLVSPKTAGELGLKIANDESGTALVPWARLELNGRAVEGPVWIQPGQADRTVGVMLGYGRAASGRVGGGVGFNAYSIWDGRTGLFAPGGRLAAAGRTYPISTTQSHWAMEGRPIVREASLAQYLERPDFARGMNTHEAPGEPRSLYPSPLAEASRKAVHAWGMSIDLNMCVGCSACMLACQSENNVPIVGKEMVGRHREMHWLRIDRYFTGGVDDPQVVNQPMLCQHCESAPCENVCPVNATVHDEEGLNVMVYNRCVGTRYCSNNCPYKVRRFNFFDYNKRPLDALKLSGPMYPTPVTHKTDGEWDLLRWFRNPDSSMRPREEWELMKLGKNPDVTVRMRGVMEKCTFCIQRIEGAKIAQKVKAGASGEIAVPDGTFTTACAQACPAGAIVFGNLKDPHSRVSQLKQQDRDYSVLDFLLTKPRTTYLARVRNPNRAMPDYQEKPLSFVEWEQHGNALEAVEKGASK
jgi:MoCo/4Fe-4S cofactor protein with predicted Tat translocation signal